MKTKEYIQEFGLADGWRPDRQKDFLDQLLSEFIALLEYNNADDNIRGFSNAVKAVRVKWDAISNKVPYGLPDKVWSYWYATTVVRLRDELCPKAAELRKQREARRRAAQEEYLKRMDGLVDHYVRDVLDSVYTQALLVYSSVVGCPESSFTELGLSTSASVDDINRRYRELVNEQHPLHGGDTDSFLNLITARNRCIRWALTQRIVKPIK